jgi:hypothetical protein
MRIIISYHGGWVKIESGYETALPLEELKRQDIQAMVTTTPLIFNYEPD